MDTTEPANSSSIILKHVFECLSSAKTSQKVCHFVMEMAVNLLTHGAWDDVGDNGPVPMETDAAMGGDAEGEEDGSGILKGEELVSPFIPKLLDFLSQVISGTVGKGGRGREGKGRSLENEFVVLSR